MNTTLVTRPNRCAANMACLLAMLSVSLLGVGCKPSASRTDGGAAKSGGKKVIRVEGSDTMINLAQAWAEAYNKKHPDVSVQVSGGGSGVGIASLIEGVVDMANASRAMEEKEIKRAEAQQGRKPVEHTVALDALAVYVKKDIPIETISLEELAEIYGDNGKITKWSQLGIKNEGCGSDDITRVGRQNNSGTYAYFREVVLGKQRDYKLGSVDQSGSKDVVTLVSRTPCAIGYSGMGYLTSEVKWLKISKKKGEPGVAPGIDSAHDGTYPLARPLYIYTLGEATDAAKDYLDWIKSDEGQKIVADLGYVPVASAPKVPGAEAAPKSETAAQAEQPKPAAEATK